MIILQKYTYVCASLSVRVHAYVSVCLCETGGGDGVSHGLELLKISGAVDGSCQGTN